MQLSLSRIQVNARSTLLLTEPQVSASWQSVRCNGKTTPAHSAHIMADPTLVQNQDRIINDCAPQPFTQFNWPAEHVTAEDTDTKSEVDHCISQFWAKNVRQLSRLATKVRANLRINTERMKASPNTWQPARDEVTRRIMTDYAELERVTESFTLEMSSLTVQVLGLDRANNRGRPVRDVDEIEECVRSGQLFVTALLDRVDTQLKAIQRSYFLYLFINPPN